MYSRMSRWAIRMCSSRCQGVYVTFRGRLLMCFIGKSATTSSKVMYDGPWTRFRTSARTASFFIGLLISSSSGRPRRPGRDGRERLQRLLEHGPQEQAPPHAGPDQVPLGDPELDPGQLRCFLEVLDRAEGAIEPAAAEDRGSAAAPFSRTRAGTRPRRL